MTGSSGGGQTVQYTPFNVAQQAGMYDVRASYQASQLAQNSIDDAINAVNKQYNNVAYAVQPYQQTGIEALDQLNQYLGLGAYNPGVAPTAPDKPTVESLASQISPVQEQMYVQANSDTNGYAPGPGQKQGYVYTGAGAYSGPAGQPQPGQTDTFGSDIWGNPSLILSNQGVKSAVDTTLAQSLLPDAQKAYQTDLQKYNTDLSNYNNNLSLYNKYQAQGPLNQQQITDKITNLPGYQAELGQGIDAIQKGSASNGMLGSGGMLKELNTFGQNTLAQFYGNELNRLSGLVTQGTNATNTLAGASQNTGNQLASLNTTLGTTQANSALASGNALAQATMAGGQQFMSVGGGGGSDLGSILGGAGSLIGALGGL